MGWDGAPAARHTPALAPSVPAYPDDALPYAQIPPPPPPPPPPSLTVLVKVSAAATSRQDRRRRNGRVDGGRRGGRQGRRLRERRVPGAQAGSQARTNAPAHGHARPRAHRPPPEHALGCRAWCGCLSADAGRVRAVPVVRLVAGVRVERAGRDLDSRGRGGEGHRRWRDVLRQLHHPCHDHEDAVGFLALPGGGGGGGAGAKGSRGRRAVGAVGGRRGTHMWASEASSPCTQQKHTPFALPCKP